MNPSRPVIIFDGVCVLCHGLVGFILRRDKDQVFLLTHNQTHAAQEILRARGEEPVDLTTVYFVKDDRCFKRSDAILMIMDSLGPPYRWLCIFRILPRAFRDWIYDVVARNRYRWFGKKDQCLVPDPKYQERFLI